MRNLAILAAFAAAAAFLTTGCDMISELGTPAVSIEVTDGGSTVTLTWPDVTDASGYKVTVDGETEEITETSFKVEDPAKMVEVIAYKGDVESDKWSRDFSAVVTDVVEVYGMSDPDTLHPSGFGFKVEDGTCLPYSFNDKPEIDFVIDDVNNTTPSFESPNKLSPPLNTKDNAILEAATTNFDAADQAAGGTFGRPVVCATDGVYYFWIDPSANGWDDTEDHFAKAKVLSIGGVKVTMKVAYQTVAGLDWLVTD